MLKTKYWILAKVINIKLGFNFLLLHNCRLVVNYSDIKSIAHAKLISAKMKKKFNWDIDFACLTLCYTKLRLHPIKLLPHANTCRIGINGKIIVSAKGQKGNAGLFAKIYRHS